MSMDNSRSSILIVCDNPFEINILKKYLDDDIYLVSVVSTEQQAMGILENLPIELILLNVSNTSPTDLNIFSKLVKNTGMIPVILIVSDSNIKSLDHYFNLGAVDIIQTPLHKKMIIQRITNQLIAVKQHNLENELSSANKMAELGNMVAEIIHEIASPLSNLKLSLDYLLEQNEKISTQFSGQILSKLSLDEYLQKTAQSLIISESSIDLATNIILSFKQVSVNQCSNKLMTFNLLHYTRDILLMLRPKLKKHQHEVILTIDERIELTSYPGAFSQIIINFVNNTLLHAFEEIEQGKIEISAEFNTETIRIIYRDNGIGMDSNLLKKAFDKFYTTKSDSGGSGLGLHICKDLITGTLQGQLILESKLGLGTTFTMDLPKVIKGDQ